MHRRLHDVMYSIAYSGWQQVHALLGRPGPHQQFGGERERRARQAGAVHERDGGRPVAVAVEERGDDAAVDDLREGLVPLGQLQPPLQPVGDPEALQAQAPLRCGACMRSALHLLFLQSLHAWPCIRPSWLPPKGEDLRLRSVQCMRGAWSMGCRDSRAGATHRSPSSCSQACMRPALRSPPRPPGPCAPP